MKNLTPFLPAVALLILIGFAVPVASPAAGPDRPAAITTDYQPGPDAQPQAGGPQGVVTKHSWTSRIFAGTVRDYWVYIPAQYDPGKVAAVMVFRDGAGAVKTNGDIRVPVVFDNLIHRQEMPGTIGIFINPGTFPATDDKPARSNRSFEYDTLSDQYVRFLLEEILPEVARTHHVTFTTDPEGRAISGQSSGGICAFTAAWERPESFHKVVSFIGSFTSIAYRPAKDGQPVSAQRGGSRWMLAEDVAGTVALEVK